MIAYSERDAARIIGKRSADIEALLGFPRPRRDDPSRRSRHDARRLRAGLNEDRFHERRHRPARERRHRRHHGRARARRASRPRRVLALAAPPTKNRALAGMAAALRAPHGRVASRECAATWTRRAPRACRARMLDRLALDEKRVEAMARGVEEIAALADPIGTDQRALDAAQRARHRARARAARRDRHHLREPAQRDLRCGRAVPEVRQCRHPARRLGERAFQPRHSCLPGRGADAPPDCRRHASSSCRPPIAPPWATCCRR